MRKDIEIKKFSVLVGMMLVLWGCGPGPKLDLGTIEWTMDGTDANRSEGYISSTSTDTFITGRLKDGGKVLILVKQINGVGTFESIRPDEDYVRYGDSISSSPRETLSAVSANIISYESGRYARIKGTVKGKKKTKPGKIVDIVGEIDAIDIGTENVKGGGGGGGGGSSYSGTNSSQVAYLISKLSAAGISFKYQTSASDTSGVSPNIARLTEPCLRDAYVASAMAFAWAAENASRIGSASAASHVQSMMKSLRDAADLCSSSPTVGSGTCSTLSYVSCEWLSSNTRSVKIDNHSRFVSQDNVIDKELKRVMSVIKLEDIHKTDVDTCKDKK
ncbi:hypothetical protein [Armatimonas sp.]|uniref:hypothetical protein n=1 Tax=Armatimonas sp. TaxID=1872638 RepID=UPI00374D0969